MATLYGVNATKRLANPATLEAQGEKNSPIKVAFDQYTLTAALAQNDVIKLMKLPAGARVLDVVLNMSASLDASGGTVDVGWEANSVDAADADGFMDDVVATAAATFMMSDDEGTRPGMFKQFSPLGGETQVTITADAAGGLDATSGTISLAVYYVID
jgi:hypothetical protein